MRVNLKAVMIVSTIFCVNTVSAQVPTAPSPKTATRHANEAVREANDVVETVQNVNDVINAFKEVRRVIDSVVANDKSKTAGEVHFIFVGIPYEHENLSKVNEALKNITGVSEVQKLQKTGSVTFQFKSSLLPIEIWKDLPRQLQKSFMVHDKDAYNVVLLYKAPPPSKSKN
ncbi:MAG: hypothetical protein ABI666_05345 [Ferruginibacter sp.]